jgi:hypothetical protein
MALALLLFALLARLPGALLVPPPAFHNIDEAEMVNTVLGLPAGLAPTALQWPAGPTIFLLTALGVVVFLSTDPSASGALLSMDPGTLLSSYFSHVGRTAVDPLHLLIPARLLLALLAAAAAPILFLASRRILGLPGRLVASLLVGLSPALLAETAVIKGDALAMTFWAPAVCLLMDALVSEPGASDPTGNRTKKLLLAALLAGLATSCRFLYLLSIVPLCLVAIAAGGRSRAGLSGRVTLLATLLALFLLPLFLFVPWIWTRPLGLAKSLLGNAMFLSTVVPANRGMGAFLLLSAGLAGFGALGLLPFGVTRLRERCGLPAVVALGGLLLTFLLPVASSHYVEPRYLLPLLPMVVLLAGGGLERLAGLLPAAPGRWLAGSLRWSVFFLVLAAVAVPVARWWSGIRAPNPMVDVARWLAGNAPPGVPVYTSTAFAGLVRPDRDSVERSLTLMESGRSMGAPRAAAILRRMGRSAGDLHPAIAETIFDEDGAMDRFILACVLEAYRTGSLAGGVAVRWFQGSPEKPDQVSTADLPEAIAREGRLLVVASGEIPHPPGAETRFQAGRWAVREYGGAKHVE